MNTPNTQDVKTALLNLELKIVTPESEKMQILLNADTIFEFDRIPEDYNKIAEQKCIPVAQQKVLEILDEMLVVMGYKALELAEKI